MSQNQPEGSNNRLAKAGGRRPDAFASRPGWLLCWSSSAKTKFGPTCFGTSSILTTNLLSELAQKVPRARTSIIYKAAEHNIIANPHQRINVHESIKNSMTTAALTTGNFENAQSYLWHGYDQRHMVLPSWISDCSSLSKSPFGNSTRAELYPSTNKNKYLLWPGTM